MTDALVIGAGPAGLMAAEMLARAGRKTLIVDARPSLGRKFLMAGKSGLNLTKDEPFEQLLQNYQESAAQLRPMLAEFDPDAVQSWATDLGQDVFTGTSGRVFPKAMKASPLLRAWIRQLAASGVEFRTRWRWVGWQGQALEFQTPQASATLTPQVTVLALGGASWARLGSDGKWAGMLQSCGVEITPFAAANAGLSLIWSDYMTRHFGAPVKGIALSAGNHRNRAEFVVSEHGLQGGGIYSVSKAVRNGADLYLDLLPDRTHAQVLGRLSAPRNKATIVNHLRKTLKLDPVKLALLMEFARPLPVGENLARLIKALPIKHHGLRPLDEAISTAGGIAWNALDKALMLKKLPGIFACGEMLDWEAPTGGYLINGCLATGRWAGKQASGWARG